MEPNPDITLRQLQTAIHEWITTIGHGYYSPLTNMAILTEEVGEVARIMAREFGEQSWREGAVKKELADELTDVIWVAATLANQAGVDLTEAMAKNVKKKTDRDTRRHQDNPKKTENKI